MKKVHILFIAFSVFASQLVFASPAADVCESRNSAELNAEVEKVREQALGLLNPESRSGALIERLKTIGERDGVYDPANLAEDVNDFTQDYVYGIIPFVAVPMTLFVLTCLACPCFTIARCCCAGSCCVSKGPFTSTQKWLPLVFYMIFSTVAMGLAFGGVYQIGSAVGGLVGSVCEVETLSTNSTAFFNEFIDPLNQLQVDVGVALNDISGVLNGTADVVTEVAVLGASVSSFSSKTASNFAQVSVPPTVEAPDSLTNAEQETAQINTEIQDSLEVVVQDLDSIRDDVNNNIVATGSEITGSLVDASNAVSNVSSTVSSTLDPFVAEAKAIFGEYVQYTERASYAFFSVVFLAFAAGALTAVTAVTPTSCDDKVGYAVFTLGWFLTYLFMLLMFLLSGVVLPLSVIASDACAFVADVPQDVDIWVEVVARLSTYAEEGNSPPFFGRRLQFAQAGGLGSDPQALGVGLVDNCFGENPSPLLDYLNVTDEFDFEQYFSALDEGFTNGLDIEQATSLTALEEYNAEIQSTPAVDNSTVVASIDSYNSNFAPSLSLAGCTPTDNCDEACVRATPGPCPAEAAPAPGQAEAREAIINGTVAIYEIDGIVAEMKSDFAAVVDQADNVTAAAVALNNKTREAFDTVKPLLEVVESVDQLGDCGFLGDRYYAITDELCRRSVGNVSSLATTCLVIGICAIPSLICSVLISSRIFHYNEKAYSNMYSNRNVLAGHEASDEKPPVAIPVKEGSYI